MTHEWSDGVLAVRHLLDRVGAPHPRCPPEVAGVWWMEGNTFREFAVSQMLLAHAEELYAGLGEKHFRFVHGLDLIPHLPPAGAAAQAAANFIPLGITSFGESFLRELDYTHAGSLYRMEMDATITHFPGLQEDEDNHYWSQVGFGTILELLVSQEQEALHNENSYLCRLRELWLASPEAP